MKKITSFIFLTIFAATCAQAKSPFEGSWIIDRYSTATGGTLTIKNCKNDVCNFYLDTENGSHICSFEGEIKIKGNEGEYKTIVKNIFDEDSEFLINFKLNHEKNIITVAGEGYTLGNIALAETNIVAKNGVLHIVRIIRSNGRNINGVHYLDNNGRDKTNHSPNRTKRLQKSYSNKAFFSRLQHIFFFIDNIKNLHYKASLGAR